MKCSKCGCDDFKTSLNQNDPSHSNIKEGDSFIHIAKGKTYYDNSYTKYKIYLRFKCKSCRNVESVEVLEPYRKKNCSNCNSSIMKAYKISIDSRKREVFIEGSCKNCNTDMSVRLCEKESLFNIDKRIIKFKESIK